MGSPDLPAIRYYRALQGAWSGAFTFQLSNPGALALAPFAIRAQVRAFALVSRLLGRRLKMSTTLAQSVERKFFHTTSIHLLGIPLFATRELISIAEDGRAFRMEGEQKSSLGRAVAYQGRGEIDEAAAAATYRIPWFGVELVQRTQVVKSGLSLTQESPWSTASVVLVRR